MPTETCARCGHPRDENASWPGHTATGCINGCECQGYRTAQQQEAWEDLRRLLKATKIRDIAWETNEALLAAHHICELYP